MFDPSFMSPETRIAWEESGGEVIEIRPGVFAAVIYDDYAIVDRGYGATYRYQRCNCCGEFSLENFAPNNERKGCVCEGCAVAIANHWWKARSGDYLTWREHGPSYYDKKDAEKQRRKKITGAARKKIFERDLYRCRYCGSHKDISLDHVIPVSKGGSDEPDNLVTACRACNSRKSDKTPEERKMILQEAGFYK